MHGQCQRKGLTLRDLIAIVVIVVLFGAFLMLRNQQGRIQTRRTVCEFNMHNISEALASLEEANGQFPGYANVVNGKRASWVVPILPYLEREDLWRAWESAPPVELPLPAGATDTMLTPGKPNPWARARLHVLLCPSSVNASIPVDGLSYVVNTGSARTANDFLAPMTNPRRWVEDRNGGVFFNRARADFALDKANPNPPTDAFAPEDGPATSIEFVFRHDGSAYTLLLSENLQATTWVSDPTDTVNKPPDPFQSEFQIRQDTGFAWFITGNKDNALPAPPTAEYNPKGIEINALAGTVAWPVPAQAYPVGDREPPTGGLAYARASSAHPGGVNVIYCDGHLQFMSQDIDYTVYTALMTPNGRDAIVALPDITATEAGWDEPARNDES